MIYITVMDENSKVIKMADPVDPEDGWGDMQLNMEMEAGKVYYFQIKEMSGGATDVKIKLTKGECAMVTFHANRDAQSDAWFDDDPSKTVKTIPIAIGEDISKYTRSGWMAEDPLKLIFSGWSLNPDLEWIDDYLIVEHDMDVYAITAEQNVITLDANGGYFRMANNSSVTRDAFGKGRPFASSMDPTMMTTPSNSQAGQETRMQKFPILTSLKVSLHPMNWMVSHSMRSMVARYLRDGMPTAAIS